MTVANERTKLKTPLQVASQLHEHADKALSIIESFRKSENKELENTLHDIKTMALLGKYYAYKISGSTQLALFRETKDKTYQNKAIEELTLALDAWKNYTETALQQNINPIWTNRVGYVDWVKITGWVEDDIKIAQAD
jgi:hypothetical protein